MSKHTDGEWEIHGLSIIVDHRGIIANIPTPIQRGVMECVDNTRLMAAAPELLKACKALRAEAAARNCGLRIADEAIAKAEGRE